MSTSQAVEVEGEDLLVRLDETADIRQFCRGCGPGHSVEDCHDIIDKEPLTAPVYMNTSNRHCYKEESAMGWIEAEQNAENPRRATDPNNRRFWALPDELKDRIPEGQFFNVDRILDLYHRGKPQLAGDMYFRTRTRITGFNVHFIVRLYENGMEHEAVDLFDFTYRRTRNAYVMTDIVDLFSAGMTDQAYRIHCLTSHCLRGMHRDTQEAIMLNYVDLGMKWFAIDVHDRTLQYVTAYDGDDILELADAGLVEQAVELHDATIHLAHPMDVTDDFLKQVEIWRNSY